MGCPASFSSQSPSSVLPTVSSHRQQTRLLCPPGIHCPEAGEPSCPSIQRGWPMPGREGPGSGAQGQHQERLVM